MEHYKLEHLISCLKEDGYNINFRKFMRFMVIASNFGLGEVTITQKEMRNRWDLKGNLTDHHRKAVDLGLLKVERPEVWLTDDGDYMSNSLTYTLDINGIENYINSREENSLKSLEPCIRESDRLSINAKRLLNHLIELYYSNFWAVKNGYIVAKNSKLQSDLFMDFSTFMLAIMECEKYGLFTRIAGRKLEDGSLIASRYYINHDALKHEPVERQRNKKLEDICDRHITSTHKKIS